MRNDLFAKSFTSYCYVRHLKGFSIFHLLKEKDLMIRVFSLEWKIFSGLKIQVTIFLFLLDLQIHNRRRQIL